VQAWQHYDPAALTDVEFEAAGPRIAVENITKPVQPSVPSTCAVCLEEFGIRSTATAAWRVSCGHVFHVKCPKNMVNGVDNNSNRCPYDRMEICVARERRRIVHVDEGEKAEEEEEADVVAEHELALSRAGYLNVSRIVSDEK
jgi:hypothetical protein